MFRSLSTGLLFVVVFSATNGLSPQLNAAAPENVQVVASVDSAQFVLVNNTSVWLSLFIDGRRSVSVPPGDQGVDAVTPGYHTFKAVTLDGSGRSVTHSGNVPAEGVQWTVTVD